MKRGFTLIEIMVSLAIFSLITVASTAALLSIIEANSKAQNLKAVMDNLNVAIENMSRLMRLGTEFRCDGNLVCSSGGNEITFTSQDNTAMRYFFDHDSGTGRVMLAKGAGDPIPLTAIEVNIQPDSKFYLNGGSTNDGQPRVLIVVKGFAGLGNSGNTTITSAEFNIQTTVSQRNLDDVNK